MNKRDLACMAATAKVISTLGVIAPPTLATYCLDGNTTEESAALGNLT